ncbi:4'-phosphopantetheinyl transferase superfamily protein [Flavobacterium sp. Fl-77]|uniref:4'-phosphopantetheinyl transferase superfamily protein n=1 Tax=Flavobacterium flavipigmentatum TaxID=2893884 RepID=A0AAJ2W1G9_9FLAO|nr:MULTISPECIES: 4'-phosphopantetheinyl transferase superfamily protein [unclassified Flavobacterium]MDX6182600.1 4'-phosphopantetheinyl transferase superfamily protein [Flavobacterium sp. Fl-33]MDX6186220.1 4'-phosphopantetheinyl transferase superfamily protein [Flavobacterium sp. Fl-77]UFH38367.1 4'-phosphopantetheinyl transferase superfamily protein [Flavobacterium sp. F-70]
MIGNDVIDLLQSRQESNWQRKGFINKIFTDDEQIIISNSSDPEIMVWVLWSMKEAAYKIYNRQTKIRAYIPKKLICSIKTHKNSSVKGLVFCDENIYHTKTMLSQDIIHTLAAASLEDLNCIIEIENKDIVKDKYGIPYLTTYPENTSQNVSISHHGRFEKVVTIRNF